LLDIDLKKILLDDQNNAERLNVDDCKTLNVKSFNILAINLNVLYNYYFEDPNKIIFRFVSS